MAEAPQEFHFSPRPNRASEINWRPWSGEAFDAARQTRKPILLSISAVWCHWCHVMDETTYSHPSVIDLINRDYVPVRVDNDVRPDINQRYNMGGWPTTAFLTASGDILTGGTYMPPDQMASALMRIADYYRENQAEIASRVLDARKREFPQTDAILLLLEQAVLRSDDSLRLRAVHTLEEMTGGGTYDHVEGGFFRYSTTQDWSVPHFEKMLEDHAGLVLALSLAGMTEALEKTVGYLDRVLRDPKTGLYAGSQDADEHYYSMEAEERANTPAPYVDRRVYTAWNAALAVAYLRARLPADRLLDRLFKHAYKKNEGMTHAEGVGSQLADQVWSLWAAVRAYQHGLGEKWREVALDLAAHIEERYGDPELGGFLDHAGGDELGRLGERIKPLGENSVAVFARALDRVGHAIKVTTKNSELARAAVAAHPYAVLDPSGDDRAVVCAGTICLAPVSTPDALKDAIKEASQARA